MADAQASRLQLVSAPAPAKANKSPLSILDEQFLPALGRFNQLHRDLRAAGIPLDGWNFPDNCMVIEEEHTELLSRAFAHEIRAARTKGFPGSWMARHTVTIRGIDVVWFTVMKEQDQ